MGKTPWVSVILIPLIGVVTSLPQDKKPVGMVKIAVTKIASTPALDADEKGFEKALADAGLKERIHVAYDRQNAKGDLADAQAIARTFVDSGVDLIHCISTPCSQAVVKAVKNIPIVFSAVADPADAGVVPRNSLPGMKTGTNVTGISDRWPVALQFETYLKIVPKAKRWGTIYHAKDAASLLHIREMRDAARKLGVELLEASILNSAEAIQAAEFLAAKVHAFYLTRDHTTFSAFDAIVKVCNERKVPLFTGDANSVQRGAIAAYGLDYFQVGLSAGRKALLVLKGEKPGDIPWRLWDAFSLVVNEKAAKAQGVVLTPELLKKADKIFGSS